MKAILAATILMLSSLPGPQVSAATPVEATLTLPHDHVLPGVPFDLVVTYTNVSDRPVAIRGARATLVVSFAGGETEVMHKPEANDRWHLGDPQQPIRLAPGESVQVAAGCDRGSVPNWFRYGSFSGPGTYRIALDLELYDLDQNALAPVRTKPVTLTRIEPVGIDAELWKRMQVISGGEWADNSFFATKPGNALADEVLQLHPTSGYYPYILALRGLSWRAKQNIRIEALLEAAGRFETSPAQPYLLKAAGDLARSEGLKAVRRGDPAAEDHYRQAESYYRRALATKSIVIRATAEEGLRDVAHGLERAAKQRQ